MNAMSDAFRPTAFEHEADWMLEVTDLKQYAYCPRVVFYRYCLPTLRPVTVKMEAGVAAHRQEIEREQRRTVAIYGLEQAERRYGVRLASNALGLSGRLDLVLVCGGERQGEAVPVDYKNARQVRSNWRPQLAAYGLLLEDAWGLPVRRGFVYLIPLRRAVEVRLGEREKEQARRLVCEVHQMIRCERMPPPTPQRGRCADCEFRRFCNDVY